MIVLKSLTILQWKGIANLEVRALRETGVHTLGGGTVAPEDSRDAAAAIRYAFTGEAEGDILPPGAGYGYVEIVFRCGDDPNVSIFRGADRRGACQVSLREDSGMRITSGEADVAARLSELLGADVAAWAAATFHGESGGLGLAALARAVADADAASVVPSAAVAPVAVRIAEPEVVAAAGDRAAAAAAAWQRARRVRVIDEGLAADFATLADLGARVRRERTDVAVATERIVSERERVRARLRRVNEYRDLVAQRRLTAGAPSGGPVPAGAASPAAPSGPRRGRLVEWGLAAAAVGCAVLVGVASWRKLPTDSKSVAGLGFVFAFGSYLWVLSRRLESQAPRMAGDLASGGPDGAHAGVPSDAGAAAGARTGGAEADPWRDALRARFADIGDPDAEDLVPSLRARLSALDDEAAPAQSRLEKLDEILALHDVEMGRASRALRRPAHSQDEAPAGLAHGETPESVLARVAALGDRIHSGSVERDALASVGDGGGVTDLDAAADRVRSTVTEMAASAGDPAAAARILGRHGFAASPDGERPAHPANSADALTVDVAEFVAEVRSAAESRTQSVEASARAAAAAQGAASRAPRSDLVGAVLAEEASSPWFAAQSLGRFRGLGADAAGIYCVGPSDDRVRIEDLDPRTRERMTLALRARLGERLMRSAAAGMGAPPRTLVVESRAAALGDDAALARFLEEHAPSVTQIVAASSPSPRRPEHPDEPGGAPPRPVLPLPGTLPGPRPRKRPDSRR